MKKVQRGFDQMQLKIQGEMIRETKINQRRVIRKEQSQLFRHIFHRLNERLRRTSFLSLLQCRSQDSGLNRCQKSESENKQRTRLLGSERGRKLAGSCRRRRSPAATRSRWRCPPPLSGCPAATSRTEARSPWCRWTFAARSPGETRSQQVSAVTRTDYRALV